MSSAVPQNISSRAREVATDRQRTGVRRWSAWFVAVALYGVGLIGQLVALAMVTRPVTEGSSYYVAVARNLVEGRGLVIDAIWSYATPPLTLPRPAFELWQPLASLVAALPMPALGTTFGAAQVAFALMGALLAPLAWLAARDAARRLALPERRAQSVTLGAGLLTAVSAPLLLSAANPDSTLPFALFGVVSCLLMPRAVSGERRALIALGVALGAAYMTRMEALWLGLTFVAAAWLTTRSFRRAVQLGVAAAAVAALVAAPWWLRNLSVFGTPLPGQVADNIFLTHNQQIFGYLDRPTLAGFLGQGLPIMAGNIAAALWHNVVDVLVVPTGPIATIGLVTVALGLRIRSVRPIGSLAFLLGAGALCYVATSVLFPVASLWGTFEHAAGPLHVGLIVAAAVGADALVARVRAWRSWPRANAWLAPAALVLMTLPITAVFLAGAAANATADGQRIDGLAETLPAALERAGVPVEAPLISDHPIWLSDGLHRAVIVLPDEQASSVVRLASDFNAGAVVLTEPRGAFPAALRDPAAAECFDELAIPGLPVGSAVFVISEACR